MFSLIRRPAERLLIDQGRVACPLRKRDADLEDCLQCAFAREVAPDAGPPFVSCRPPRKLLLLP
jgi:hypothetical protein